MGSKLELLKVGSEAEASYSHGGVFGSRCVDIGCKVVKASGHRGFVSSFSVLVSVCVCLESFIFNIFYYFYDSICYDDHAFCSDIPCCLYVPHPSLYLPCVGSGAWKPRNVEKSIVHILSWWKNAFFWISVAPPNPQGCCDLTDLA